MSVLLRKYALAAAALLLVMGLLFYPRGWEAELKRKVRAANPPVWAIEQIREDLRPFSGVTPEMLDQVMASDPGDLFLVRYAVQAKKVSMVHRPDLSGVALSRAKIVHEVLQDLASQVALPEVDFIVTMHDFLEGAAGPIFTFAKKCSSVGILFPDPEALSGNRKEMEEIARGKKRFPWSKKMAKGFWRGATTGRGFSSATFLELLRAKVVDASLKHPEAVDAKFTQLEQCQDPESVRAVFPNYFAKRVQIDKHLAYKYQLLLDGNSCAYVRAYWQLFSECPIFKHDSSHIQWYYRGLKPGIHYIPLKADCSNLIDKIEWAKAHDQEVRTIGKNAYKFAKANLTRAAVLYYVYLLLQEYADHSRHR